MIISLSLSLSLSVCLSVIQILCAGGERYCWAHSMIQGIKQMCFMVFLLYFLLLDVYYSHYYYYFFNYTVKKNLDTELCIHIDLFLQKLYQFVQRRSCGGGKYLAQQPLFASSACNGQIVIIFIIIINNILYSLIKRRSYSS